MWIDYITFLNNISLIKIRKYTELLEENNITEIKKLIDFSKDTSYFFSYLQKACEHSNYKLLSFLLKKIPINIENNESETILYKNCLNKSVDLIKYLIKKGARYNISDTVNHPLFSSINNNQVFSYLLNISNINLNIYDNSFNSIAMILANSNSINKLKYFQGIYIQKYGKKEMKKYFLHRNYQNYNILDIASLNNNFEILRLIAPYFSEEKINLQGKTNDYVLYNYRKRVFIVKKKYTFEGFFSKIISHMNCYEWRTMTNVRQIRKLYNSGLDLGIIISAVSLCHTENRSHDYESIIYVYNRIIQENAVMKIQKFIKDKFKTSEKIKSTIIIQRFYRRKIKNSKSLSNNSCVICLQILSTYKCQELNCCHIFHKQCLLIWRKEKNNCPICRKIIIHSPNHT